MNTSASTSSEPVIPDSKHRESVASFCQWAAQQMEISPDELSGLPLEQLAARLQALEGPLHTRPREQPMSVNDVAHRLLQAYQVDGGKLHLAGCQLADLPFLRITFPVPDNPEEVGHLFVAHDGSAADDTLVHELGIDQVEPWLKAPPRIDDASLSSLMAAGRRIAAKAASSRDPKAVSIDPLATTLVWVKQTSGQLQFTIGDVTARLPFSGWARTIQAKPFVGPMSGASTFHLAATDDGQIEAAEQIASCEVTGARCLIQNLVTSSVTGKRVKKELTIPCPVSGQPTLEDEFETCPLCQSRVSKASLKDGSCTACQNLRPIRKDDPRLVWILGEHAGLDRWNKWQLSETLEVYIVQATSLLKQLLVVVDKETLLIRHLATRGRFAKDWTPVLEEHRAEILN